MAGKKKDTASNNNNGTSTAEENAARSSTSNADEQEAPQRLTDTIPRFIADEYEVNSQVLCLYSGFYYDAKIVGVRKQESSGETLYKIHYQGWAKRYDEEITHADARQRFLVFSPENLALAKRELSEARTRKPSKSSNKKTEKKSKKEESEEKKSTTTSQSTMPNSEETREQSSQAEDGIEASSVEGSEPGPTSSLAPNTEKENVVDFPENLLKALMDDYDLITRQKKLIKTPPRFTIDDVLLAYLNSASTPEDSDQLRRKLDVLVEFFNKMINMNLLYKAELQQHLDLLNAKRKEFGEEGVAMRDLSKYCDIFDGPGNGKENASKSKKKGTPSKAFMEKFHRENDYNFLDCYGFVHFIRFCYHYKCLLKNDANDEHEKYSKYAELIDDMIKFYNMNTKKYFIVNKDYETAC